MRFWFFPCWSGDFRLERDPADVTRCVLTVEDPTDGDVAKLVPFLADARKRKWLPRKPKGAGADLHAKGVTLLALSAPPATVGPVLAQYAFMGDGETWSAIRCVGGKVSVVDGAVLPKTETPIEAVATVKAPTRGCPEPQPCDRRASQVLRTFCTASQWSDFETHGSMRVIGNATGKAYRVYHRDEAAKRGLDRALVDSETGHTICVWDVDVPAEEEALSLKLAVEHREAWLLKLGDRRFKDVHLRAHRGVIDETGY